MQTAEEVLADARRLSEEFNLENGREDVELTEAALKSAIRRSRRISVMLHGKANLASFSISKKTALEEVPDIIKAGLDVVFYSSTGGLWISA